MAETIIISPASGDDYAMLYSGSSATSEQLETVPKGTVMKVIGSNSKFYEVEYDNGQPNVPGGGSLLTGTIVAYPYAYMFNDTLKTKKIANINNGTPIKIIDETNSNMIKIQALTTEGILEGYVEAKYIYKDLTPEEGGEIVPPPEDEEAIELHRKTILSMNLNNRIARSPKATTTGTVTPSNGVKTRTGPGTSYKQVGAFNKGAVVTIHETKNGWHRVTGSSGWGDLSNVWVSAQYIKTTGSNASAGVSKSDSIPAQSGSSAEMDYVKRFNSSTISVTANDEYYRKLASKYGNALGTPPKYNMDIDIQYTDFITAGGGRVINRTLMSSPSILSICPGKVEMFPDMLGSKKDTFFDAMYQAANGNSKLLDKIKADEPAMFSGKMYRFVADTQNYAKYVNGLCRASAILLGIGDKLVPYTTTKLKDFDYTYWSIRNKYNPMQAASQDPDGSMFRNFWNGLLKTGKRILSVPTDDTSYINFFLNGSETSVSESITNSHSASPLENIVNGASSAGALLNYFTGSGFNISDADATQAIEAALGNAGETFSGIIKLGENFMKGGRMVLPDMIDGASYGKSISVSTRFISPYGDKYSIFLKCIVPVCHILALTLPKQLSDNMYTFPFLIRASQLGSFNVDLGLITSLNITRGGSDDTSYSTNGVATEWDVQMEITPLVNELMMTPTDHPVLFCKNEMMLDYLGNFCGFDVLAAQLDTKMDLMMTFVKNIFLDWPPSLENKLSDTIYNVTRGLFRYSW